MTVRELLQAIDKARLNYDDDEPPFDSLPVVTIDGAGEYVAVFAAELADETPDLILFVN